ncbi:hypothetical protein EOT10_08410 [Streptomyces antnestii]|uniref:Uncharacterized protein n=1 Tax=Streptomyces antnestii TaxID=2494256 RepID=A0A3S2W3S8_9ACTN|nr:hypothetical protein [Streptomyces sp. San01]RVU27189.1 hypothetical protein EOT10_08410 [Streptomyces sp. San01]
MGFFSRKTDNSEPSTPSNPAMAELGRDYAIAKRHGDRKAMNRITREIGKSRVTDADGESFRRGQQAYEDVPPAYSKPRRNRRR